MILSPYARASRSFLNLVSFDPAQLWRPCLLTWPRSGQLLECCLTQPECPTEFGSFSSLKYNIAADMRRSAYTERSRFLVAGRQS